MLCEWCGKNPGTIQFASIINEHKNVVYICEQCAKEKGLVFGSHFSLADLLSSMADMEIAVKGEKQKLKCGKCNLTYSDFKKTGRFGCGECYEAFAENLEPMLRRIQGNIQHIGKTPKGFKKKELKDVPAANSIIKELKVKLQQAIEQENFEEAAKLRDAIREEEKKG